MGKTWSICSPPQRVKSRTEGRGRERVTEAARHQGRPLHEEHGSIPRLRTARRPLPEGGNARRPSCLQAALEEE
eukprot:8066648-Alexandrium_andersonii.AAC.1